MGDTVLLCVHGIQSGPERFSEVERALAGRFDVVRLLLPGHGSDVRSFRTSGMDAWQACVDEEIDDLRRKYRRIVYLGHSMGGLLGIDACLRGHCVDAMILLACPLRIRMTWRYLCNSVCAVLGWWDQNPFVHATRLGNSVQARHPWEYLSCARPYGQLLRKSRDVRRRVGALTIPVAALHGSRDEIVHRRSLDCFKGMANASQRILSGCGHEYYTEEARGIILAMVEAALGSDAVQTD